MQGTTAISKNRLIIVGIILMTTGMAIVMSLMLVRSMTFAIVVYTLGVSLTVLFFEPFLGLINYIFFLYIRLQEFLPGFTGLPVILVIGGSTFALILTHMAIRRSSLGLKNAPQHFFIVWFFFAIILSNLVQGNVMAAYISVQSQLSMYLLYFLVVALLVSEGKIRFFMYHLLVMTLFLALAGIFQHFTGRGVAGQELVATRIAWVGIFGDPNDLALAMLMIMPFPILLMVSHNSRFLRLVFFLCVLILGACVVFTESRGGILAMGFLVPVAAARRYGYKLALVMALVMAVGIFVFGPSRMGQISTEEASAHERIESWTVGIGMFQSSPLFGIGAQRFTLYHFITAHNSFVLAAAELGLFGLFPWIFLFYISIKNLHFVNRESSKRGWAGLELLSEAALLGLVVWFCAALFLSRTYSPLLFILFGLAVGITSVFVDKTGEKYALVEKSDFLGAFAVTMGGLFALKVFLILAW
jgi:O-antigen ligase